MPRTELNVNLLKNITKAGVGVIYPTDTEGMICYVDDSECAFDVETGSILCHSTPHYKGNAGFFHIKAGEGECILLKSRYIDAIRIIKRGISLNSEALLEVSRTLTKIDGELSGYHEVWFFYIPAKSDIKIIKVTPFTKKIAAKLDMTIPRPLTSTEYEADLSTLPDKNLLSRAFLPLIFPETLSHTSSELVKSFYDAINAFFISLEVKVQSPSQKVVDLRPYLNFSGIIKALKETKQSLSMFEEQYLPWQKIFADEKRAKPALFLSKRLPVKEIDGFMDDTANLFKPNLSLFDPNFFSPVVNFAMLAVMINTLLNEQLLYFSSYLKIDTERALQIIYKSRANSLFIKGGELSVPEFFDLSCEQREVKFAPSDKLISMDEAFSCVSGFNKGAKRRGGQKLLADIHALLDLKDKLMPLISEYHRRARGEVLEHGGHILKKGKIDQLEDVFHFDIADIKKLSYDIFYMDVKPIRQHRESYKLRAAAQIMPYDLYEADIPFAGMITEDQLHGMLEQESFICKSYNGKTAIEGVVGDDIKCANAFTLAHIQDLYGAKAVLTSIAPAFSYITEFCTVNNIPLYYGVRHCETVLKGKRVSLQGEMITTIANI
ncbi:MAG: hypothetical protein LBV09_01945 [Deferribacteraceae bacterium]|jgi:hypothetical protein|nr:hypothetical protein [Deferribacteraceae bacterium]